MAANAREMLPLDTESRIYLAFKKSHQGFHGCYNHKARVYFHLETIYY